MLTNLFSGLRRRPRAADDAGVTLIEVIVAMTLSTILGTAALLFFTAANDSAASSLDRSVSSAQARIALQSWTSYLRVSDGPAAGNPSHRFEWITSTSTLFYADLGNRTGDAAAAAPRMVWLRYDGSASQLVEEQFTKSGSAYSATPTVCRILATSVTGLTFSGYTSSAGDSDFGISLAPSGSGCVSLTGSVSQTDAVANAVLAKVTSVSISVTVTDTKAQHTQTYNSLAAVPALVGS
jgi:prepilin-type N-terminal cleavage/methylation domain-containing protein